jgi:hypothetical protein
MLPIIPLVASRLLFAVGIAAGVYAAKRLADYNFEKRMDILMKKALEQRQAPNVPESIESIQARFKQAE